VAKKSDPEEWRKDAQEKLLLTKFDGIMPGQNFEMSEEMMAEEPPLLDHVEDKRYLILSGTSSFLAIVGITAPHAVPLFLLLSPFLFISAIVAIAKFGRDFFNPFFLCTFISLPFSFWEYVNQSRNGCLSFGFPGSSGCPPAPPGYDAPRIIFLIFQIFLMMFAYNELVKKNWKGMYGIVYAMSFSAFVYFIAYFVGLW